MATSTSVTDLRCEHLTNPLGIDVQQPRLSWKLAADRRGARQNAYQIIAASSQSAVQAGNGDLWDSGQDRSDQSIFVPYGGEGAQSGQRVWWAVRVWDETNQVSAYSQPAWWEMGLLDRAEWGGQWIGSTLVGGLQTATPAPYLRKTFTVDKPISAARLYITALGLYECSINEQPVSQDVFAPGWTDYFTRVQYQVYDVGALLQPGGNAIGAILGDGWYCGYVGFNLRRQAYGDSPHLLAQLTIQYADGTSQTVVTDASWKTTVGAILESDMMNGESYDARREFPGWDTASFDDAGWWPVKVFDDPGIELSAMRGPTVRRIQELQPTIEPIEKHLDKRHTAWIFDLGQNMVGWVRLKVTGEAGQTVRMRFAEMLQPDGHIYTENLRSAKCADFYTLRGGGEEIYEPHFTFHGFRYVEVEGFPGTPGIETITGIVVHSDMKPSGTFECSDPLLNQLQQNIIWGQKGNFVDVPTDCPQRDERLGWTGDAQVFIRTATHNFDVGGFFNKWQQDLTDSQLDDGAIPRVAPNGVKIVVDGDSGPAWADAVVICPWTIWQTYGDTGLLAQHYDSMVAFMNHHEQVSLKHIRCHPDAGGWLGHGDWLSINAETPKDLIGTAFYAYDAYLMSQIAGALGKTADEAKYRQLFETVRRAFLDRFVTHDGLVIGQTQTAYLLALHFNLLPDEFRPVVAQSLVRDIQDRNMHLSTGFVGSPYLLHVLANTGRLDIAYKLLNQRSWPSYLYPVTQGATTIWERWDGWTDDKGFQDARMNSFNHYAYGAVGAWLYAAVGGIDVGEPGYKHIIMHPNPGGGLTSAATTYESPYGLIESRWLISDKMFTWQVVVPPNTSATIYVPGTDVTENNQPAAQTPGVSFLRQEGKCAVYEVQAGRYHFTARMLDD